MTERIHVVAAVLRDATDRVLIAQRLAGTHMAGRWEFPGGKLKLGESRQAGLLRELKEELGVAVTQCSPLLRLRHDYPEREVLLDIWQVQHYEGVPTGIEGQALKWLPVSQLDTADLLEADKPIVDALRLPDRYAITPQEPPSNLDQFVNQIDAAVDAGVRLFQLRVPGIAAERLHELAVAAVQVAGAGSVLINGAPEISIPLALTTGAAGIHLPSRYLPQLPGLAKPPGFLLGASCHNVEQLTLAASGGANFAVLGPVLPTTTHPNEPGLGWDRFGDLTDLANLPVYALGGVGTDYIDQARALGGQGVAGIRAFFPA